MAKASADREYWEKLAAEKRKADLDVFRDIVNDANLSEEEKDRRIIMHSLKQAAIGGNPQAAKVFLDATSEDGVARVELSADDYMLIRAEAAKRVVEWTEQHKSNG